MAEERKCFKCQKEITSGRCYIFYTGKKGGNRMVRYELRNTGNDFFCPSCAKTEKANPTNNVSPENLLETEWEIGNKTDEETLEFEKKWQKYYINNQFTEEDKDTDEKTILTWCQEAQRELEPYLQKPEIVEKSFGGKLEGYGNSAMSFYYLFAKSAAGVKYRQEVVEPTIAEILGVVKLNSVINTTIRGNVPGAPGRADGTLEIDSKYKVNYSWTDGPAGFFRRICFETFDQKFVLQSFCRALKIKEKELRGDDSPTQPEKDKSKSPEKINNMEPDRKIIKEYFLNNGIHLFQLYDNDNSLIVLYYENKKNSPKFKDKSEWTTEEKYIESYLKKQGKKFLNRAEVNGWTDIEISKPTKNLSSNPTNWTLIISLSISGIVIFGIIIFLLLQYAK